MFSALNRFISRLDGDAPSNKKDNSHGAFGFQVLRNENLQLGIEPWFDFLVGINGRMIDDPDPRLFAQEVRNCAGGSVMLGLWSAKGQRTRALHVPVPADTGSIGLSLQWTHLAVASNIWHVLDVPANSPADAAGLLPYGDYILGSPEGTLHGEGGLSELVEDHIGRPLRLYVYNNEYDVTRELSIQPSRDWGGQGALGCVLGYGALHRLPAPLSEPVSAPGETLFDGDGSSDPVSAAAAAAAFTGPPPSSSPADLLVPAQMVGAAEGAGSASGPPRGARKKERHGHGHGHHGGGPNLMDDYFREEEKKSRELDNAPSGGRATPVAPPPKAGGPPKGSPRVTSPPQQQSQPKPDDSTAAEDGGVD